MEGLGIEGGAWQDVMADVGDGDQQAHAASRQRLGPHRVVEVACIGPIDGDQVQSAQVPARLRARFGLGDASLDPGRRIHHRAGEVVAEALRHHQREHVLRRVPGASEGAHHLALQGLPASGWGQPHADDVAILRQLRPGDAHQAGDGAFIRPHHRLTTLDLVGADQFRALPLHDFQHLGLGAAAAAVHAHPDAVAVEGTGGFRRGDEEVLLFADVDKAEPPLVDLKPPFADQAPAPSGVPLGVPSPVRCGAGWGLGRLGQGEALAVAAHGARAHQLGQSPFGRRPLGAGKPRAPQQVLQPERLRRSAQRLQQDRGLEGHARGPRGQAFTETVRRTVLWTCAGAKALARKKSTSKTPGLRGVKKNSRTPGPLWEG